ncbi:MAG TPA: hypothetical protein VKA38_10295 [Draconibacterium sp.]|nr:hypothetical protein [Draconibacterium sp.]
MLKDKKHTAIEELLDEILTTEPEYSLSDGFANKLAREAGRKYMLEQYFREFLIYLGALVGIAAVLAGMALIWYRSNVQEWFDLLLSHISLVAGINVLIVFILLTDKVLLPYLFYRSSLKEI